MTYALMIVESPNKIEKISSIVGPGYRLAASYGHIRDLPSDGGVGVTFADGKILPQYEVVAEKKKQVARLRELAAGAELIILATDPDREGEAIAWHVREVLGPKRYRYQRVRFQSITQQGVSEAMANHCDIDENLVDAAQARRVIDRALGWYVSPTCRGGTGNPKATSAGRVQSVALRILAEREEEIQAFVPVDFLVLRAQLESPGRKPAFTAELIRLGEEAVGQRMTDRPTAEAWHQHLSSPDRRWLVHSVDAKDRTVRPPEPFKTSTAQQAASVKLGWEPDRTMKALQSLFESGHITYHRTDSPALSPEGVAAARAIIAERFPDCLPTEANHFGASANAQEAHEAIRPTHPEGGPGAVQGPEADLYALIWERFVASQMTPGVDQLTVAVLAVDDQVFFEARGKVQRTAGWRSVFQDATDESEVEEGKGAKGADDRPLPPLAVGEAVSLTSLEVVARATKAPNRFTQASLIKKLEAEGIGRPSTYAAIMTKLMTKGYAQEMRGKRALVCTDVGLDLVRFLVHAYAGDFIEIAYTRRMESTLDQIAQGKVCWHGAITTACETALAKAKAVGYQDGESSGEPMPACPDCGRPMRKRDGSRGAFLGCSGYPKCKKIINLP